MTHTVQEKLDKPPEEEDSEDEYKTALLDSNVNIEGQKL